MRHSGDSLAAGVAALRPECLSDTKVGISTEAYLRTHTIAVNAETVLISLGVNDGPPTVGTARRPQALRDGVAARRVFWILPARPPETRALIRAIADLRGDRLIETKSFTAGDGLHLTSHAYRAISLIFDLP